VCVCVCVCVRVHVRVRVRVRVRVCVYMNPRWSIFRSQRGRSKVIKCKADMKRHESCHTHE